MIEKSKIKTEFKDFKDTAIWERYMLNAAQFSATKEIAKVKLIQEKLNDENGVTRSFSAFKKESSQIADTVNETWLRTEYDMCIHSTTMAEQFRDFQADSDLYPYWQYQGVMDEREREEHVDLEGLIFRIGDPDGDECYPPNDWNCRCSAEQVDDQYLEDNNLKVVTTEEAKGYLDSDVDPQFRNNPAIQGSLPNEGSYFEVMKSANEGNASLFDLPRSIDIQGNELEGLSSGMQLFLETVHEWRKKYEVNKKGEIIFQNDDLLTNVILSDNTLHKIQKHLKGFENIPKTIESPNEVWSLWENKKHQRVVLRNYILFGKQNYVVSTRDGVITDAIAVTNTKTEQYRKGVIL